MKTQAILLTCYIKLVNLYPDTKGRVRVRVSVSVRVRVSVRDIFTLKERAGVTA
jgi:hypothetical protein